MTKRSIIVFLTAFIAIFVIDQSIKYHFINGFRYESGIISLVFVLNKGVAFSMFAFLGEYLKYIQIALISALVIYLIYEKELFRKYYLYFGMLISAGVSNVYDRFVHGGVVDYIYWHYGFEFAIFNFADVIIDISVVVIAFCTIFRDKKDRV